MACRPARSTTWSRPSARTATSPNPRVWKGGVALIDRRQCCSPARSCSRAYRQSARSVNATDAIMNGRVGGDRVVTAAQVLHERVPGGDGIQGSDRGLADLPRPWMNAAATLAATVVLTPSNRSDDATARRRQAFARGAKARTRSRDPLPTVNTEAMALHGTLIVQMSGYAESRAGFRRSRAAADALL
jgi:hypothetical protein